MKKIIIILLVIPVLSSCQDWLDEEPKAVATETFYNTEQEADAAVLAPLAKLRNGYAMSYPGLMECFTDYSYGRGSWTSNSDYKGLDTQNMTRANGIWASMYNAIRDCNIAIEKLPNATAMTDEQKTRYIAELKFIRALSYFELVRLWKSVPLRTPENMAEWNLGKTSSEDIYNFIIEDLKFAIDNCPENSRLVGTPNQNTAKSLLAKVYMFQNKHNEALPLLESVITSNKYTLLTIEKSRDFEKIFGPTVVSTPEEIFYLKNVRPDSKGWEFVMFCAHPGAKIDGKQMHGAGGWYGLYTTTENAMISEWDVKDLRKEYNIFPLDFGMGDNTFLMAKYYDPEAPNAHGAGNSNPLIRYTDILLYYAEAATIVNGKPTTDAMEKLNMIHRRAYGYSPTSPSEIDYKLSDYSTKEQFMELVMREQAYEAMNEGKRWLELVRWGIAKEVIKKIKGLDIADKHFLFPIPTTEFDYNEGLDPTTDQNPGY
ncbi:RagB/SusD family nutrient uptake outer membrane protein [Massilibacteroides sp.]|uniref:RagB/SusD family nutrient uptake outer membrane protein n=1 Tax=Massilibacteroides sp. TaxID=2034766 RepID=UPI002625BF71|nr:RagB/SusD family nutrient uptake outer membrane protein [Massilibacteroides sp.]MDD4515503.1 RagB/SusD family nutrient uptake outer membrane protein [Massilibacteroides sp.]